jgi:AcrR family transcriptional regulator
MSRARPKDAATSRLEATRLPRADRRDVLIDAAAQLVKSGDVESVSVEAVAEKAGVSRPLVYKHFANRTELLAAVYQRESALLQREIATAIGDAPDLEGKLRAYVAGCLSAEAERGATFAALRSAGVRNRTHRDEQRDRDRRTVRYFANFAVDEFRTDPKEAREAMSVLLASITAVLAQWRRRPTKDHAVLLEDLYVRMAIGGLRALPRD